MGSGFFVEVGQFASARSMYEKFQLKAGLYSWSEAHTDLEMQSNYLTSTISRFSINRLRSFQQSELTLLLGCCSGLVSAV